MPTSSSRANPAKQPSFFRRHPILVSLAVLLLAVLLAAFIYLQLDARRQQQALAEENRRFAAAEKEVADLTSRIIAATGQPLKVEGDKSCTKSDMKFVQNTITCSIEENLFYGINNHIQANVIQSSVRQLGGDIWKTASKSVNGNKTEFTEEPVKADSGATDFYQKINEVYTFDEEYTQCGTVSSLYSSSKPPDSNFQVPTDKQYIIYINIYCNIKSSVDRY